MAQRQGLIRWRRPQAAGAASRIEAVCRRPRPSTQVTRTVSPGWRLERVEVRDDGEVMVVPSTPTIVSPMEMPADSAGPPATIPPTRAPDPGFCCTATPRYPRCVAGAGGVGTVPPPARICAATCSAWLMGMAKPTPPPALNRTREDAAVSMPPTGPAPFTSGPPESPGWRAALVWMRPLRFSEVPAVGSLAVMSRLRPTTRPWLIDGGPGPARAMATDTTPSPTRPLEESPKGATLRPDAPWSWITDTSSATAVPTIVAV